LPSRTEEVVDELEVPEEIVAATVATNVPNANTAAMRQAKKV